VPVLITITLGVLLLAAGGATAYRRAPRTPTPGVPAPAWFPDPASDEPRQRFWDGRAWTGHVAPGEVAADRGRRFRGRFWGPWALWLLGSLVVLLGGAAVYRATGQVHVIGVVSLVSMSGVCWAFYRFVDRQLALRDVIGPLPVVAVAVATAGAALLVAGPLNSWVVDMWGIRTATATVGLVEEGTKVLVPLALFLLSAYRDPRAGIALGLASGFGFAVMETTRYAYQLPAASGPSFCSGVSIATDPATVAQAQVLRVLLVSPLHWLWTGIAVAIAWRLWHLDGRRGTPGAVGGLLLVMVLHSLNDSSATAFCDRPEVGSTVGVLKLVLLPLMYLVLRAAARRSTPPQLVARTSRGWTPPHLPTRVAGDAPAIAPAPVGVADDATTDPGAEPLR
jgi:RsiW-degrading membrane proteinase PrsW (M82 family)